MSIFQRSFVLERTKYKPSFMEDGDIYLLIQGHSTTFTIIQGHKRVEINKMSQTVRTDKTLSFRALTPGPGFVHTMSFRMNTANEQ